MPLTPSDVVQRVAAGVSRLMAGRLSEADRQSQLDELAEAYAENTDVRHPFAPGDGAVLRTRAHLRAHFSSAPTQLPGLTAFDVTGAHVHLTDDPEVVIFEFRYRVVRDGKEYDILNINVVRVRAGEIVQSRDYVDHVAAAQAFGKLPSGDEHVKPDGAGS